MQSKKKERWYHKVFRNLVVWFAKQLLKPVPILGALVEVVAFAL